MAPVTDLTWVQLNEAFQNLLQTNENIISTDAYGRPTNFNFTPIIPEINSQQNPLGVLKFVTKLLDACKIAQDRVNAEIPKGEKLNSFPAVTNKAPANNLVEITRTVVTKSDLNTATKVVGNNI